MKFDDEIFGNSKIHPNAFVSKHALIIGRVIAEQDVIIKAGAWVIADEGAPFRICKGTNIQEGVRIHGLFEKYVEVDKSKYSVYIGPHCSIAHGAIIHGPSAIDKKTFVGFDAKIHNSRVGRNCYIGLGAIIVGVNIADNRYVRHGMVVDCQEIADSLPMTTEEQKHFNKEVVDYNKKKLVPLYKERRKLKEKMKN